MTLIPGVFPFAQDWDQASVPPEVAEQLNMDRQQTFEWTQMLHYGLLPDLVKMDVEAFDVAPCSVCGEDTTQACSDCMIDTGLTVFVCSEGDCMDAHESERCSFREDP